MSRDVIERRIRQLIAIDRNAVDIYTDLFGVVEERAIKNSLEALIGDERRHLRLLEEILSLVN